MIFNYADIKPGRPGPVGKLGSLSDLKIKISDYLPDDTILMNPQSFEKFKCWYILSK